MCDWIDGMDSTIILSSIIRDNESNQNIPHHQKQTNTIFINPLQSITSPLQLAGRISLLARGRIGSVSTRRSVR